MSDIRFFTYSLIVRYEGLPFMRTLTHHVADQLNDRSEEFVI